MAEKKSIPSFGKLSKGFLGFLQGIGKASATVNSYGADLAMLEKFLAARKKDFYSLNAKDFAAYEVWLEKQGMKTNTRRRKILTAKSLVRYAVSRKKLAASSIQFVKSPDRLERLPWIPTVKNWVAIAAHLKPKTNLDLRNAVLAHLLAETGITVAELCDLRSDQIKGARLELEGKKPRNIRLEAKTAALISEWKQKHKGKFLLPGFNRHGITSQKMTPRGVELVFRALSRKSGFPHLKPKTLRHFAVAQFLRKEIPDPEILRILGVRKSYSLDAYRKHLATC